MSDITQPLTSLLGMSRAVLREWVLAQELPAYRGDQIFQWIHQHGVASFDLMTTLSRAVREQLSSCAQVAAPEVVWDKLASDGTRKWLLRLSDGNCIEMVFIPEENRGTLCVSSQVGCSLTCDFCATAKQGFSRHLTADEIIGQVWVAARSLSLKQGAHDRAITNVVMMGMGEPLMNFEPVVQAMDIMMDDLGYGLSKRRVTLSTSGVVPMMLELKKRSGVSLAVSLHAPIDELRNQLVPINRKYPLSELMTVCREYFENDPRRVVTFEYVMIDGVNDTPTHAKQLIALLRRHQVPCKVNLIPFNPFPGTSYRRSTSEAIRVFQNMLMSAEIHTTIRKTRGSDIEAACGQLAGEFHDRTLRRIRYQVRVEQQERI